MYPYLSLVFNLHLFVLASSRYLFVSHSLSVWLFLRNNNFFFIDQRAFRSIIFMVSFLSWDGSPSGSTSHANSESTSVTMKTKLSKMRLIWLKTLPLCWSWLPFWITTKYNQGFVLSSRELDKRLKGSICLIKMTYIG